jgi:hypothetical protein
MLGVVQIDITIIYNGPDISIMVWKLLTSQLVSPHRATACIVRELGITTASAPYQWVTRQQSLKCFI